MIQADNIEKTTFSGHESFTLRYGWLTKAVRAISDDPNIFAQEDALVRLGVGKNMVRSIRHWAIVCGIIEPAPELGRSAFQVSDLGKFLLGKKGVDQFLEDPRHLPKIWLDHSLQHDGLPFLSD